LIFLLPHPEDRATHSNSRTQSDENEEEANNSQEEEKEAPRNIGEKKQNRDTSHCPTPTPTRYIPEQHSGNINEGLVYAAT
jgi:hypothetical protein